jgi:hypothetical protein
MTRASPLVSPRGRRLSRQRATIKTSQ